jgi:integrase
MAKKYCYSGKWYIKTKASGEWKNIYIGLQKTANTGSGLTSSEVEMIRKKYEAKEINAKNEMVVRRIDETINDAIDEFLKSDLLKGKATNNLASGSKKSYESQIESIKIWFIKKNINHFNQISIDVVNDFVSDHPGLSSLTLSGQQRVLIRFLKWADTKGYWQFSSKLNAVNRVKKTKKPPKFLSVDDLHRLFDNCNPHYKNAIKFMYYIGCRVSEVGFFKWSDYNEDVGTIRFDIHDGTKTKRVIELFICDAAKEIIAEQKEINGDFPYIFKSISGKKLEGRYLAEQIKDTFEKLNIDATSHVLRHTFASQLAINGVSLIEIRDLLRHKDISETQIYAHLCSDSQKNALKKLPV